MATLQMARHHPIMEDIMMSSKDVHIFLMELPHVLEHYVKRFQMRREDKRPMRVKESS
jgi:hypothetical protein